MNENDVKEYMNNIEFQMNNCQHLFVKLRKGLYYSSFHSTDYGNSPHVVVCLKCDLTNKYIESSFEEKDQTLLRR